MEKRTYNILFDLHTVAGIIISVALYVIFFCGTISFLRDEIIAWERNEPVQNGFFDEIDFDNLVYKLSKKDTLYSRDLSFRTYTKENRIGGFMSPRKDVTEEKSKGEGRRKGFFGIDSKTGDKYSYEESYSLGEFFYRLHFFAQLNFAGRQGYIFAGVVSFFFLFTLITGLIVHWDKILSSFYLFRPNVAWKTIWTDAHVGLGLLGFPYQLMFSITGCYFIVGSMFMIEPASKFLFEDEKMTYEAFNYEKKIDLEFSNKPLENYIHLNDFVKKAKQEYPEMLVEEVKATNFGDENMYVEIKGRRNYNKSFIGSYHLAYLAKDGSLIYKKNDKNTSYIQGVENVLARLHFGDYGGYGVRIMYIILGFLGCFIILSGVMIWFVARDKKSTSEKKRKMNRWVANVYLSICLSMLPITALTFILIKFFGADIPLSERKTVIYEIFFYGWFLLSLFFIYKKDNNFTNKTALLLSGILSILVAIIDGVVTKNWLWNSFQNGELQIFAVNLFWILVGTTSLYAYTRVIKKQKIYNKYE